MKQDEFAKLEPCQVCHTIKTKKHLVCSVCTTTLSDLKLEVAALEGKIEHLEMLIDQTQIKTGTKVYPI